MTDIIIVGGGPAGLTAAIYGARSGKSVILFEGKGFGGQIGKSHKVENYPGYEQISGFELSMKLKAQAELFGAELITAKVKRVEEKDGYFSVAADKDYEARAVIFALGAEQRPGTRADVQRMLAGHGNRCHR